MSNSMTPTADRPLIPKGYGAPSHTRELLPWSHVERRLAETRVYWLATITPDSRPYVRPVDALYVDGRIFVGGSPDTRWMQNLRVNPDVSVHLDGVDHVAIVEGVAETVTPDHAQAERLAAASNAKFPEYGMTVASYEGQPTVAIRPRRAYAWSAFPKDVTRFRFEDATQPSAPRR
jgi:nitroimidazol reductase NimA-like FMN-containing flavoprotein (pyridoxamine 5'-phosphate oxidase superfamily)